MRRGGDRNAAGAPAVEGRAAMADTVLMPRALHSLNKLKKTDRK